MLLLMQMDMELRKILPLGGGRVGLGTLQGHFI